MTQTTTQQNLWTDEIDHLSGIATTSHKLAEGLGALHIRLQVDQDETRFMFSAVDFSRLISGKMVRGFDRDAFDEQSNPITAKKLGDYVVFEVYGVHEYYVRYSDLRALWSFEKPSLFISGKKPMSRTETILRIAINAMDGFLPADRLPGRKMIGV